MPEEGGFEDEVGNRKFPEIVCMAVDLPVVSRCAGPAWLLFARLQYLGIQGLIQAAAHTRKVERRLNLWVFAFRPDRCASCHVSDIRTS